MADRYAANARYIAPAQGAGSPGRFLVTALLVFVGWLFLRELALLSVGRGSDIGATRTSFFLELMAFALLIVVLNWAMQRTYQRHWTSLLGDRTRLLGDFTGVLGGCLALYGALILMGWDPTLVTQRPLLPWLAFLPIALFGIFIQTGAEEIFFRGFLHQYAAAWLKKPVLWLFLPSLVFGLSHAFNDPASVLTALSYIVWTTAFAIACVDLTARTGSLGAAWGLHMAVNITALTVASNAGAPMSAAALFLFPERAPEYETSGAFALIAMAFELFFLFVLWLVARNVVRR
ncbi:MAG: CPBP family intramembrane glutamic endopeptidase [Pseudomonadota bacterium]